MNELFSHIHIADSISFSPMFLVVLLVPTFLFVKSRIEESKNIKAAIRVMLRNYRSMSNASDIRVSNREEVQLLEKSAFYREFENECKIMKYKKIGFFTQTSDAAVNYNCVYWVNEISSILSFVQIGESETLYSLELIHEFNGGYEVCINRPFGSFSMNQNLRIYLAPKILGLNAFVLYFKSLKIDFSTNDIPDADKVIYLTNEIAAIKSEYAKQSDFMFTKENLKAMLPACSDKHINLLYKYQKEVSDELSK